MSLESNNARTAPAAVLLQKPHYYRQGAVTNGDAYQFLEDNNSGPSEIVFLKPDNPRIQLPWETSQIVATGYSCSYGPAVHVRR